MSGPDDYDVTWLPECLRATDRLISRISDGAAKSTLADLLHETRLRLKQNPRDWGDPRQNLRGMKATIYVKTFLAEGLTVVYAVHNREPSVFVHSLVPIPNGPFDL